MFFENLVPSVLLFCVLMLSYKTIQIINKIAIFHFFAAHENGS